MKKQIAGLFVIASLLLLSACGQKGPLYLKKEPAAAATVVDVEKTADESQSESKSSEPSEKKD